MRSVRKSFIHGGKETPQKDGFSVWHSGSANVEQFDFLGSLENQCAALAGSFAFVADGSREISLVCDHIRSIPVNAVPRCEKAVWRDFWPRVM